MGAARGLFIWLLCLGLGLGGCEEASYVMEIKPTPSPSNAFPHTGPCLGVAAAMASDQINIPELKVLPNFQTAGVHLTLTTTLGDVVLKARFCKQGVYKVYSTTDFYPIPGQNSGSSEQAASIFWLEPDTSYDLEVLAQSPDTGEAVAVRTSFRTRVDTVPQASGSSVFVSPSGSDTAAGTQAAPFKTISRALSAMSGTASLVRTIELLAGTYRGETVLNIAGTPGSYRVLRGRPGVVFDGADAAIQTGVAWTLDPANGTYSYGPLTVASPPVKHVHVERAGTSRRLYPYEHLTHATLPSLHGSAVAGVQGGFYFNPATSTVHIRLPDANSSPSDYKISVSTANVGVRVDKVGYWVIEGIEARHYQEAGIQVRGGAGVWVRANKVSEGAGISTVQPWGQPELMPAQAVIEDNEIRDVSIWDWGYAACKFHACETTAITSSCSPGHVIRRNLVEGTFNGIAPTGGIEPVAGAVPVCGSGGDTYDNTIQQVADDGIEVDGPGVNQRIFRNRILSRHTNSISLSPLTHGPIFVLRNVSDGYGEGFIKLRNSNERGWKIVAHNTAIPDVQGWGRPFDLSYCVDGLQAFNNILMAPASVAGKNPAYTLTYQTGASASGGTCSPAIVNNAFNSNLHYKPADPLAPNLIAVLWGSALARYPDLAAFRAATGHELLGIQAEPRLESTGYLPAEGSPVLDAGQLLPGINDQTPDASPDIGALER